MSNTKSVKRSMRAISPQGKLNAIRRVHDGESKASVARDIGVPESTLRGWCKNETKISFQTRQNSPPSSEDSEPKEKRLKMEEPMQPFNLSLKNTHHPYTPSSESLYTPMDYSKNDTDCTPKTPQNLSFKNETPKSTASQERTNRAELARMSVEYRLNQPEIVNTPSTASILDMALINHLNLFMLREQQKKLQAESTSLGASTSAVKSQPTKSPKEEQKANEYNMNSWANKDASSMKYHNAVNNYPTATIPNGPSTSAAVTANNSRSSSASSSAAAAAAAAAASNAWFLNLWKTNYQQPSAGIPFAEKAILYQQLTRENEAAIGRNSYSPSEARAILDHCMHQNNNNVAVEPKKTECMSASEGVAHGEKFLKWMESFSNPSVTATQIMQLRSLLSKVKSGVNSKNGDLQNKTKVKRK